MSVESEASAPQMQEVVCELPFVTLSKAAQRWNTTTQTLPVGHDSTKLVTCCVCVCVSVH